MMQGSSGSFRAKGRKASPARRTIIETEVCNCTARWMFLCEPSTNRSDFGPRGVRAASERRASSSQIRREHRPDRGLARQEHRDRARSPPRARQYAPGAGALRAHCGQWASYGQTPEPNPGAVLPSAGRQNGDSKEMIVNPQGFITLFIALVGLIPICRDKRWNWRDVRSSTLLTSLFRSGWSGSLIVGTLVLLRVVG